MRGWDLSVFTKIEFKITFTGATCVSPWGCTGIDTAKAVAEKCLEDLGKSEGTPAWLEYKALPERKTTWKGLGILPEIGGSAAINSLHHSPHYFFYKGVVRGVQ